MNKYQKRNKARFAGALVCIFISNAFAVILQFFKGDILDNAISGETGATLQSIILLINTEGDTDPAGYVRIINR